MRGPASAASGGLALENEALRTKLAQARAAADAREYEAAKEREVRVMTHGQYADRDVDILRIKNANILRDLKTLAHENLRTKRRYKLAKRTLEETERALIDAQGDDVTLAGTNAFGAQGSQHSLASTAFASRRPAGIPGVVPAVGPAAAPYTLPASLPPQAAPYGRGPIHGLAGGPARGPRTNIPGVVRK